MPVRYAGTYGPGATSLAINGALLISGAAAGMTPSTHFALDAGYPDSTHFSHSLRRIYGLKPTALFSGSRRLQIINGRDVASDLTGLRA